MAIIDFAEGDRVSKMRRYCRFNRERSQRRRLNFIADGDSDAFGYPVALSSATEVADYLGEDF